MPQDHHTFRRAVHTALIGLAVQAAVTIALAILGLWAADVHPAYAMAVNAAAWYALGGCAIWLILAVTYNLHRLERVEALETQRLTAGDVKSSALFDAHAEDLQAARQRLNFVHKWVLSVVTASLALYLLAIGLYLLWRNLGYFERLRTLPVPTEGVGPVLLITAAVAFAGFIVARYVSGMSGQREWQMLRGGASYLMGNSLAAALILAGAALLAAAGWPIVVQLLTLLIPFIMALVGAEFVLNLVLAAYRPRAPGDLPTPAFDSRLLGWLARPESIGKIVSQTINYQFGIEVSRSWFYRLLARSLTPLIAVAILVLILISSIIIVGPHQQALITRFGAAENAVGPGLHFKWPWPIGAVTVVDTGRVQEINVGSYTTSGPNVAILWTNPHTQGEETYFIAAPSSYAHDTPTPEPETPAETTPQPATVPAAARSAPGVSLVAAQINIQYHITDLKQYLTNSQDPPARLRAIAQRIVSAYFVTKDIDTLLSAGQHAAADDLLRLISAETDRQNLGIKIMFVGVLGVHPPQMGDVAAAFEEQIAAGQEKETKILAARQKAIQSLASAVGSVETASRISAAITQLEDLRRELESLSAAANRDAPAISAKAAQVSAQEARVDALLAAAPGSASALLADARAQRWKTSLATRAAAQTFQAELLAARQSPRYYKDRGLYTALAEALIKSRKYIVGSDQPVPGTFRFHLEDARYTAGTIFNAP